jgi:hypothetical protein
MNVPFKNGTFHSLAPALKSACVCERGGIETVNGAGHSMDVVRESESAAESVRGCETMLNVD